MVTAIISLFNGNLQLLISGAVFHPNFQTFYWQLLSLFGFGLLFLGAYLFLKRRFVSRQQNLAGDLDRQEIQHRPTIADSSQKVTDELTQLVSRGVNALLELRGEHPFKTYGLR